MRAPGRLWAVRDPSSSLSLAFLPPLPPPLPLLLLPPPSRAGQLAVAGRDGTRTAKPPARGGAAPRPKQVSWGGAAGCAGRGRSPVPGSAVGRRARAAEGEGWSGPQGNLRVSLLLGAPTAARGPELVNWWGSAREFGAGLRRARPCPCDPPPPSKCDVLLLFAGFSRGTGTPLPKPTPPFQDRIRPIYSLPSRQLEMTGCEDASDIRGRPAWAFGGAASSRLPRRVPRNRRRLPAPPPWLSAGLPGPLRRSPSQPVPDCSGIICLPGCLSHSLESCSLDNETRACLSFSLTAFKIRYQVYSRRWANICWLWEHSSPQAQLEARTDLRRVKAA